MLLPKLKNVKEIFVQLHDHLDKQMVEAYINFSPKQFAEFIAINTLHGNYKKIGEEKNIAANNAMTHLGNFDIATKRKNF